MKLHVLLLPRLQWTAHMHVMSWLACYPSSSDSGLDSSCYMARSAALPAGPQLP